jgi:SAM-dependent methyltransferase
MERGQLTRVGDFIPMGNYDPLGERVPERSVDLVSCFIGLHHSPADRLDGFVHSIWKILRPGGKLLIRDHDVDSREMDAMVGLAHDVYNAGIGISWKENHAQVRNFRSLADLQAYLEQRGFRRQGTSLRQDGDPTRNTLLVFAKQNGNLPPA